VYQQFSKHFWPQSTLGLPVFGFKKTVESFTAEVVNKRLADILVGCRIVVAAAGNVSADDVVSFAQQTFGQLEQGTRPEAGSQHTGSGIYLISHPVNQVYLTLGFPWPSLRDERFIPGAIFSTLFGESMSSRLFQAVREQAGLAYDISTEFDCYAETAALLVNATVERSKLEQLLDLVIQELQDIRTNHVNTDEVARAVKFLSAQVAMEVDSLDNRLWRMVEGEINYGRYISTEEVAKQVRACKPEDITATVEHWLDDSNALMVLGGDVKDYQLPAPIVEMFGSQPQVVNEEDS